MSQADLDAWDHMEDRRAELVDRAEKRIAMHPESLRDDLERRYMAMDLDELREALDLRDALDRDLFTRRNLHLTDRDEPEFGPVAAAFVEVGEYNPDDRGQGYDGRLFGQEPGEWRQPA